MSSPRCLTGEDVLKMDRNCATQYILNLHYYHDYPGKHFNRKESTDSGISAMSRKTSTTSNISIGSIMEEPGEDTIKEEIVYVEPDMETCEKITQQVTLLI